jgi:Tripartite tricarboxylate transporter family receptor/alpha/beta hydrolase fold
VVESTQTHLKLRGGENPETVLLRRWKGVADPVLYVHGFTFPSALSVAYRFNGRSWADHLHAHGFDVWAFDFLGYGGSTRPLQMAGIDVTAVGYRGYPEMVADIATGRITSTFLSGSQALAQVQTGAIRIIGTINDGRTKYFPDVPTMAEQGFAEAQVTPWFGIVVPTGTPQPIVDRISKALETALATPNVRQKLDNAGCEPKSAPLGQFADIIKADVAVWAKVVKDAGITAD